jgi:hypothetical protein
MENRLDSIIINTDIREWYNNKLKKRNYQEILDFLDITRKTDEEENIVWHYTKFETIEKIFRKEKVVFKLTNCKDTNDKSESLVLREFFKGNKKDILLAEDAKSIRDKIPKNIQEKIGNEEIENEIELLNKSYIFSASHSKNSFVFWNAEYARTDGVAIGIYKDKTRDKFDKDYKDYMMYFEDVLYIDPFSKNNDYDCCVKKIVSAELYETYKTFSSFYKNNSNENLYEEIIVKKYGGLINIFLNIFSSFYKHISWKEENESRIIFYDHNNVHDKKIEFIGNEIKSKVSFNFDKDIIHSIMLGPNCNERHKYLLKKYLEKNGYDIEIEESRAFELRHTK